MTDQVSGQQLAICVSDNFGRYNFANGLWAGEGETDAPDDAGAADGPAHLLLVGAGPEAEFYLSYLENVMGTRPPVLGVLDSRSEAPRAQTINGIRILGNFAQLRSRSGVRLFLSLWHCVRPGACRTGGAGCCPVF